MRRFGLIGFLVLALLVGAVGVVAYNAGVSTGAADAAIAEGATVVYQPSNWSPFGLLFGLFFLLLVVGLVSKVLFMPRMPYGPGGWGRHRWVGRREWDHEDVPEPFRPMLERWHEQAHRSPTGPEGRPGGAPDGSPPGARGGPSGLGSTTVPQAGPPGVGGSGQGPTWPPPPTGR